MSTSLAEQLKLLIKLQEIDLDLDRFREECEAILPAEIESKKSEISALKGDAEDRKKSATDVQVKHKNVELEIAAKDAAIKKLKNELNSVKTNDQYKAMMSEISKIENEKAKLEDQILTLLEKIDEQKNTLKEEVKTIKTDEDKVLSEIKQLEDKKAEFEKQIDTLAAERKQISEQISHDKLKRYEHIRKKSRDGIVIVPIENNICGSCHIGLPPQVINEVSKNDDLVFCDNCSRILCILK